MGIRRDNEEKFEPNRRGSQADRIKHYLAKSEISIDAHLRHRQLALAEALRGRIKIYLDTSYWVNLRKADIGIGSQQMLELLALLRTLVASGHAICPLSESTFLELLNQTDPASRRATAVVMDILSLSVTLIESRMRMATEVSHWLHDMCSQSELYPLESLVWCKGASILGFTHSIADLHNDRLILAIQKCYFDELWDTPFREMVERAGETMQPVATEFAATAERLNACNVINAHKAKSFQKIYYDEVCGAVDLVDDVIEQVIDVIGIRGGVLPADFDDRPQQRAVDTIMRHIADALGKGKLRDKLPSFHITASLHAAVRWDKQRKFDGHDLLDISHASAALGYCDYFFTEKPLADLLAQKHLQLERQHGCKVCGTPAQALAVVRTLAATQ